MEYKHAMEALKAFKVIKRQRPLTKQEEREVAKAFATCLSECSKESLIDREIVASTSVADLLNAINKQSKLC